MATLFASKKQKKKNNGISSTSSLSNNNNKRKRDIAATNELLVTDDDDNDNNVVNRLLLSSSSDKGNVLNIDDDYQDYDNDTTRMSLDNSNNKIQQNTGNFNDTNNYTNNYNDTIFHTSFNTFGLVEPLLKVCTAMGYKKPTPVQRCVIPFLLHNTQSHVIALAETGSGKTASFVLPILHHCSYDPYSIYAVILTPTRELAKQIHQQILVFGQSTYNIRSTLVIGGLDSVRQSTIIDSTLPHCIVATPGRFAELLRGPHPPRINYIKYLVLDEADRLLTAGSGFEKDIAELLVHTQTTTATTNTATTDTPSVNPKTTTKTTLRQPQPSKRTNTCQTLFFTATMSKSLQKIEEMIQYSSSLPLKKFIIGDDGENVDRKPAAKVSKDEDDDTADNVEENENGTDSNNNNNVSKVDQATYGTPKVPAGLKQEYIFMPSRVRDAYLLTTIRTLMINGGRMKAATATTQKQHFNNKKKKWNDVKKSNMDILESVLKKKGDNNDDDNNDNEAITDETGNTIIKSKSAIIFVSTCERAATISGILEQVGVPNVALHSLLSQNRRLAALGKFVSEQVRILVATDIAARGLDIPSVDLIINCELPRNCIQYIHRVGRTARAGRRGRAISLVSETDIMLVQRCEQLSGRTFDKCNDITDDMALKLLGPTAKAARLVKMKLLEIGFDELIRKMKERKQRDKMDRIRIQRKLHKSIKRQKKATT